MSKETILEGLGKYLNLVSHLWNEAYCQNNFADQDQLVAIQIGKYIQKSGFQLQPQNPYQVGVRIPKFSKERCYGALYAPDSKLLNDILAQLGDLDGSSRQEESERQGEQLGSSEPPAEGEPTIVTTTVDSADEKEEEEAQLRRHKKPRPPLSHPFIPLPPTKTYSCPPKSPTPPLSTPTPLPKSPTPQPKSPTPLLNTPTPSPKSPTPQPKYLTPPLNTPTPSPKSPTPQPKSPTPPPNTPIPPPKSPSPPPKTPTSPPESPNPTPISPTLRTHKYRICC